MTLSILSGTLVWLASAAIAGTPLEGVAALQSHDDGYVAARDALVHAQDLGNEDLVNLLQSDDWQVRLSAATVVGWRTHATDYGEAALLPPIRTRAGFYRFPASDKLHDVTYFPAFAERLLHTETDAGVRGALAELIARTDADWAPVVFQALVEEPDADAKAMMISVMRHGPKGVAEQSFVAGAADSDVAVREAVALQCAWLSGSDVAARLLGVLLADDAADVRAAAARSVGVLQLTDLSPALVGLISDPASGVRLNALRALDRAGIDASSYAVKLIEDRDDKVRRAAERILANPSP